MYRSLLGALFVLGLGALAALARDYEGTVTKLDTNTNLLTVKVGDAEKTFKISKDTTFTGPMGKEIPREALGKLAEKLGEKGRPATITTKEADGKEEMEDNKPVAAKVAIKRSKQ